MFGNNTFFGQKFFFNIITYWICKNVESQNTSLQLFHSLDTNKVLEIKRLYEKSRPAQTKSSVPLT